MTAQTDAFDSDAGQVAAELVRRGIGPHQRVRIIVDPAAAFLAASRSSRAMAELAGQSDADIDQLIREERKAVNDQLGHGPGGSPG